MKQDTSLNVCIIVANPGDETLWEGDINLMNSMWRCFISSLCHSSFPDRTPKSSQALSKLGAKGTMADMDPEDLSSLRFPTRNCNNPL